MPSDDLILNVRQIAQYAATASAQVGDTMLLQRGGLGGPYQSIAPAALVSTALAIGEAPLMVGYPAPSDSDPTQIFTGGVSFDADGPLFWNAYVANLQNKYLTSGAAGALRFDLASGFQFIFAPPGAAGAALTDYSVPLSISGAGYVAVGDQMLLGRDPGLPLEAATKNYADTVNMITMDYVNQQLAAIITVNSFNGRTGDVTLTLVDVENAGGAPIVSPYFGGCPAAPTADPDSHSNQIATTAWVQRAIVQYIDNLLVCHPFVFSFNTRQGVITLTLDDVETALYSGAPNAPTPQAGDNSDRIATTAFVETGLRTTYAPIDSPVFTGVPQGPTAATGNVSGQLATTAFVANALAGSVAGVSSFNTRTGAIVLTPADIVAADGALLAGPQFTGVPTAPTAAPGTASDQLATCQFVMDQVGAAGVASFNGRTGAVTLTTADITGAGGAPLNSPALVGAPTSPTPPPGTNTTNIATTAFVTAAIAALDFGVSSFNGRSGAVTLTSADISAAGGAPSASPALTGVPTAPTAVSSTNTTQLATTAFVQAVIAATPSVNGFNGRTGFVTLTGADITGAGGALLAGPQFTGVPTAPTAAPGTNTTQLSTCAFVAAAIAAAASTTTPLMDGTAAVGNATTWARANHVHPTDTSRYAASNPSGFQTAGQVSASLANYVPLAGNVIMTGSLTIGPGSAGNALSLTMSGANNTTTISLFDTPGGNDRMNIYFDHTNQSAVVTNAPAGTLFFLDSAGQFNYTGGVGVANKSVAGPWAANSDARIKTVLGGYMPGLDAVLSLKPVIFTFKGNDTPTGALGKLEGPGRRAAYSGPAPYPGSDRYALAQNAKQFVGLVAQDVEGACPDLVTRGKGFIDGRPVDDLRNLDITNVTYMLVNAVKALAGRVAALEASA